MKLRFVEREIKVKSDPFIKLIDGNGNQVDSSIMTVRILQSNEDGDVVFDFEESRYKERWIDVPLCNEQTGEEIK